MIQDYYEFIARVRIVSGHDVLEKIPDELKKMGAIKPLIVTDKGVSEVGLVDVLKNALEEKIIIGKIVDDVPQDSDIRIVEHLAKEYREVGCDCLIALGGGSVLDTAKGINIMVSEGVNDLMKFTGKGVVKKALKPLIAIPTTAGTGSEMTQAAVIEDHEKKLKKLFVSPFISPDVAILDSRMTSTLPKAITAATAMDAMAHAVEAYTCLGKNPMSDACALIAIKLIRENLLTVMKSPEDKNGRLALANAATLAGMAFSNSLPGVVHSLGHSVGSVCGLPHGVCMAILLPYGLEYNLHKNEQLTAELLLPIAGEEEFVKTPKHLRAERTIYFIRKLNQDLHDVSDHRHARFFKEVLDREGKRMVPRERLPEIARTALGDGTVIYNPEDVDVDDLLMIIESAWEGIPLDRSRIKKG